MDHRVNLAIRILQHDLVKPVNVRHVASQVGLSASAFRVLFRKAIGSAPTQFVKRLRLERARQMLCCETLSVKQIMVAVGCSDASHFVRDFERAYGLSPARYRRESFTTLHVSARGHEPSADVRVMTPMTEPEPAR